MTCDYFSFSSSLFFVFCQETIYQKLSFVFPFLVVKKYLESLRKNHKYSPYNEKIVKYKLITVLPGVFVAIAQRLCKWQCVLLILIPVGGQEIESSEFRAGPRVCSYVYLINPLRKWFAFEFCLWCISFSHL